ncbi:MAG TPA: DNA translocase FtsK 4TM domain-containing protein [Candidatus Polarisedimenticolaceae bacterium]|nr:DNA translocase FtsK 4TM domain-containing protein [Candidatus Polarisedimenticolaceae bacterium]
MDVTFAKWRKKRWFDEVAGLLLLLFAVLATCALASYHGTDATWFQRQPDLHRAANWIGRVGATLAELLLQLLGTASFLVPVVLAITGWNRFRGRSVAASYGRLLGLVALLVALATLLDLLYGRIVYGGEGFGAGGYVGARLAGALSDLMNPLGAMLTAGTFLAATIVLTTRFSFARTAEKVGAGMGARVENGLALWKARREAKHKEQQKRAVEKKHAKSASAREKVPDPTMPPGRRPAIPLAEDREDFDLPPRPAPPSAPPKVTTRAAAPTKKEAPAKQATLLEAAPAGGYSLPPLELLNEPKPQEGESEQDLLARAQIIADKFREFAVDGKVVAIHPGPVVTTFEYAPEAGVRYSKIVGLVDDLCMGLKAESIRIDRIPGRSTVGIEVPNRHQEVIFPRELLASDKYRASKSKLTMAFGKDINGEVFTAELERMPHLLIAGATGAGKSVGLNGMITSILYKATPADVRFIMIDTKMIELGMYAEIPHLLIPVVTDPKHASTALKWAVREMEQRYKKLASIGVRNIDQFNHALAETPSRTMKDERTGEEKALSPLPFIVIVIDEMADLMMVSSADVEESIMRLAQMARAVGIHLILATQRPSVDVITGTIKANFPARIAYRVSQRVDSRTIIDQQGAEHLIGRGDMLFLPSGSARLSRLHSGYITEPELNRIVAFLKKQAKPVYDESVLKDPEEEKSGTFDAGDRDTMYVEAVRLVLQEGMCSITLIQRRMRLGYARAARIVDMMEQEGIIGPADGSKPRELLVGSEILETLA